MNAARILIIDDEEHLRETMQFALEAVGFRAETAADGTEGLAKFGPGQEWDLVLLDQRMPGMEGLEALRQMRGRDPSARIMMVTAYGTIELAVDAMKAGAVDFLRKPFTPEVLRSAVKATLALPRQPVTTEDASLSRLMSLTPPLSQHSSRMPLIHFRTLNGFKLWPAPLPEGGQETEALRIRRAYEVQTPAGDIHQCLVDVTTTVRGLVREETGEDHPPDDPIWDAIARSALSNQLWEKAELPADNFLVYGLTRDQLLTIRSLVGLRPGAWKRKADR